MHMPSSTYAHVGGWVGGVYVGVNVLLSVHVYRMEHFVHQELKKVVCISDLTLCWFY